MAKNEAKSTDTTSLIKIVHRQIDKLFVKLEKVKGAKLIEQFNRIYIIILILLCKN
ncbi:hypothetical protein [Nostoc sp.]|uniref:hypothetical protein n=1 Tax=Nostoc sp. TaxID=1180 RepID=UPI002FFB2298